MARKRHVIKAIPKRRTPRDIRKLSRALLELAQAEAERAAEAEHAAHTEQRP